MATINDDGARDRRPGREPTGLTVSPWNFLLFVPLIGVLIPPMYNIRNPELFGLPFFYWWQLLWVPITMVLTVLVSTRTGKRTGNRR